VNPQPASKRIFIVWKYAESAVLNNESGTSLRADPAPILEIEPGDAYAGGLGGRFSEPNQALRGRVRQWAQQNRVYHAENRRVDADAEREGQDMEQLRSRCSGLWHLKGPGSGVGADRVELRIDLPEGDALPLVHTFVQPFEAAVLVSQQVGFLRGRFDGFPRGPGALFPAA